MRGTKPLCAAARRGVRQYKGHLDVVTCLAAPRTRAVLLSGSEDGSVLVWGQASAEALRSLREGIHGVGPVRAMRYQACPRSARVT